MAEISKLTDRILEEAKSKAEAIKAEGKSKSDNIAAVSKRQQELKYNSIVEKGILEAEALKDRLRSSAKLKARDHELKAKQEVIHNVYEAALKDLISIDDERYLSYLNQNASFSENSILIVPEKRIDLVKKAYPKAKIDTARFCESGFIEVIGGIEKNFTFGTQLDYIKDEVQGELAKVLFK